MPLKPNWTPWPSREPDPEQWERELRFAAKVQALMLESRDTVVGQVHASGFSVPYYRVGGDYFDLLPLPGGGLRVIVADVMGKGFGPAMIMAMIRSAVRAVSDQCTSPGSLLARINDLSFFDLQRLGSFVTMLCIDWRGESQFVTMASAGHPPPLHLRRDQGLAEWIEVRGVSLGMLAHRQYQEFTVTMAPRDRLLVYSDGMVEARSADGRELAAAGLKQLALGHAGTEADAFIIALLQGVSSHTGGAGPRDDVTLVVLDFGEPSPQGA